MMIFQKKMDQDTEKIMDSLPSKEENLTQELKDLRKSGPSISEIDKEKGRVLGKATVPLSQFYEDLEYKQWFGLDSGGSVLLSITIGDNL